jgi:ElaA protein
LTPKYKTKSQNLQGKNFKGSGNYNFFTADRIFKNLLHYHYHFFCLMPLRFELKPFKDLPIDELYAIMRLRQRVFVLEQSCAFVDCDNLDQPSWHLMCYTGDTLAAYCRLLPVDTAYPGYASIGRVVSEPDLRKNGYGKLLMTEALAKCSELFGPAPLKIGAQLYLRRFYESYGFTIAGEVYIEDDIEHIHMVIQN